MTRKKKLVLGISLVVLLIAAIATPFVRREMLLRNSKAEVRRVYAKLPAEVIENINSTPVRIELPPFNALAHPIETLDFGGYSIRVLKPDAREPAAGQVRLTYPRYDVIIREPFSQAVSDSYARTLNFHTYFELLSASYETRLLDLDGQKNLDSLHLFIVLVTAKPQLSRCIERFDREDLRGFILSPTPATKRYTVETFIAAGNSGCGIWFTDKGGMTTGDIHEFLGVLRFLTNRTASGRSAPPQMSTQMNTDKISTNCYQIAPDHCRAGLGFSFFPGFSL